MSLPNEATCICPAPPGACSCGLGVAACLGEATDPQCPYSGPLAHDLATDRPWPEAVFAWASTRPPDSLVYPRFSYRSAITAADEALIAASGGRPLPSPDGTFLYTEFPAAALATFARNDHAALQARIEAVEFGWVLCQY